MGDYSLVRDQTGAVLGLWLKHPDDVPPDQGLVDALLFKEGGPAREWIGLPRRVVKNSFDSKGGSFMMFRGEAPGEGAGVTRHGYWVDSDGCKVEERESRP